MIWQEVLERDHNLTVDACRAVLLEFDWMNPSSVSNSRNYL